MPKKIDDPKKTRTPRKVRFELNNDDDDAEVEDDDDNNNRTYRIVVKQKQSHFDNYPVKLVNTPKKNEPKVHGTGNYVNGTLNFSTIDYNNYVQPRTIQTTTRKKEPKIETNPIHFRNQLTNDASAKNVRKNCSNDQKYWDNAVNRRGILLHVSSDNQQADKIKFHTNKFRRYTSVLMGPSKYFQRSRNRLLNCSKKSSTFSNTLELPKQNQLKKKKKSNSKYSENPFEKFSYKLVSIKSATKKRAQVKPCEPSEFDERALAIVCNAFNNQTELGPQCTSNNLSEILQLAHRWQSDAQPTPTSDNNNISTHESIKSVESCTLKKIDVKL